MSQLLIGNVGDLRSAIAEATRTDQTTAEAVAGRFIELSPGLVSKLGAKRHHMLRGRRGTGKSTHLYVVRHELDKRGTAVPIVDMERFKGRQYPDVLLEILIALLGAIRPSLHAKRFLPDLRQRRKVARLRKRLQVALRDPQELATTVSRTNASKLGARLKGGASAQAHGVGLDVGLDTGRTRSNETRVSGEFAELKIDRMKQLAPEIAGVLSGLVAHSEDGFALIFLDDFYFVRIADQARVLDFLHQVCKGTGVWLKVGGVGSRLRPFVDGDPPTGMQPTQDIDNLPIDVTLSDFASGKNFLEAVLDGVMKPIGTTTRELFTDTARDRMVLACGGAVARDYLTLTEAAVQEAIARLNKEKVVGADAVVSVQAEDVHRAVGKRISAKESDSIKLDANEDALTLNQRWRDVCELCKETGDTAFVLVEQSRLESEEWGKEILQLENLRLVHRIGEAVPNTPSWRGRRAVIFMIDLGQMVNQRMTTGVTPFWESQAEFDKLRRAQWVYDPEWRGRPKLPKAVKGGDATDSASAEPQPEDIPLF